MSLLVSSTIVVFFLLFTFLRFALTFFLLSAFRFYRTLRREGRSVDATLPVSAARDPSNILVSGFEGVRAMSRSLLAKNVDAT